MKNIFKKIIITIIKTYKFTLSPFLGYNCRYFPSCSDYSIEAIEKTGIVRGVYLSLKRILTCHPLKFLGGGKGVDLVPNKEINKKNG